MREILPSGLGRFHCKFCGLELRVRNTNQVPSLLKIGSNYQFVMHALLALSATHLAWLTDCPLTANMAYVHRGIALKGLHEAIGEFSRQNSDAVLGASLLLSWQATEW